MPLLSIANFLLWSSYTQLFHNKRWHEGVGVPCRTEVSGCCRVLGVLGGGVDECVVLLPHICTHTYTCIRTCTHICTHTYTCTHNCTPIAPILASIVRHIVLTVGQLTKLIYLTQVVWYSVCCIYSLVSCPTVSTMCLTMDTSMGAMGVQLWVQDSSCMGLSMLYL